jgi:hypothetical protein
MASSRLFLSSYTKLWVTAVAFLGSVALGIGLLWSPGGREWSLLFVFVVPTALGIMRMLIRCRSCGYPLAFSERRVLGLTIYAVRGPFPAAKCPRCTDDLKKQI